MDRQKVGDIACHADDRKAQSVDPVRLRVLGQCLIGPDYLCSGRSGGHRFFRGPRGLL